MAVSSAPDPRDKLGDRLAQGTQHRDGVMRTARGMMRNLLLSGVLALPAWFWATPGLAAITPAYLTCDGPQIINKGISGGCGGGWKITYAQGPIGTGFQTDPTLSQLIGYVNTTQVAGTAPVYLSCVSRAAAGQLPPKATNGCTNRWIITATPSTNAQNSPTFDSSFIGYVFTTQVTDTAAAYLECNAGWTGVPTKAISLCGNQWITTYTPGNNTFSSPTSFATLIGYMYPTPPVNTYTLSPKYFIGSVIYVPPGQGPSSITYAAGTVTGTTVSTTDSWNNSTSISITSNPISSLGGGTVSVGETWTVGGSTTQSLDVQSAQSTSTVYRGPASNTINHDYDQILIYLGVKLHAAQDYLGNISWSMDFSQILSQGYAENGYPISVGCLRANSTIPAALCTATTDFLTSVGITASDYPSLLGADPFADPTASVAPDARRFLLIDAVSFFPDPTAVTATYSESNNITTTNSSTTSFSYSVNVGLSIPLLKISDTLTFTDSSALSNKTGSTSSSGFTLSLPSSPYSGPSTLYVYMDTVYKTFMFSFIP